MRAGLTGLAVPLGGAYWYQFLTGVTPLAPRRSYTR